MRRRLLLLVLVPFMLIGAMAPAAQATARHWEFEGAYFPAGMPGTGTECPYTWQDPAFCIIDPGEQTVLPGGRIRIRDMELYELAYAWRDGVVEPRKTGYDVVTAHANLDATLSGPTWGTWRLHNFEGDLMFEGTFVGAFENGVPAVRFNGAGTGIYEGERMRGDIGRVADPFNMVGVVLETGAR